jgi:hypothetical protein
LRSFFFPKNRDRLLDGEVAAEFLSAVLAQLSVKRLPSNDHFSVDGPLIEASASMKSFTPKGAGESSNDEMDDPPPGGRA